MGRQREGETGRRETEREWGQGDRGEREGG